MMDYLKTLIVLAAPLAIDAHGGLMIPPCRNNHGNVNIFNFTKQADEKYLPALHVVRSTGLRSTWWSTDLFNSINTDTRSTLTLVL